MTVVYQAYQVAAYVKSLPRFDFCAFQPADHAGEILSNAVLQAGVNYRTVVAPRVRRIRQTYPESVTVRGFRRVLLQHGSRHVLQWSHGEKPQRLELLTDLFHDEGVDVAADIRDWLRDPGNRNRLLGVRGVGPKTVDYMGLLVGLSGVAVDRHVRAFIEKAGVQASSYNEVKAIVEFAADMLEVPRHMLDYSIWRYESEPQYDLFASPRPRQLA